MSVELVGCSEGSDIEIDLGNWEREGIAERCGAKWGAFALSIIAGLGAIIGTLILSTGLAFPPAFVLICTVLSGIGLGFFQVLHIQEQSLLNGG